MGYLIPCDALRAGGLDEFGTTYWEVALFFGERFEFGANIFNGHVVSVTELHNPRQ